MRKFFVGRLARNSGWLVFLLALAGLALAVFILAAGPWALPPSIVDRASISSAIGGLFALITAIAAISAAVWINTSDFKAEQGVTEDTARVRAALRSILVKGVQLENSHRKGTSKTFDKEREVINEFISSTTAFGYWSWMDHRSIQAGHASEGWRLFFFYFAQLLDACDKPENREVMMASAVRLEALLADLTRRDVNTISSYVADLTGALGVAAASGDTMLAALATRYAEDLTVPDKFRHLERKGISSPNVELYLGVFGDDVDRVKKALDAGADQSLTDKEVLTAYKSQLEDFDPSEWQ